MGNADHSFTVGYSMGLAVVPLKNILSLLLDVIWHLGLLSKCREYFRFIPSQHDVALIKL